ncbi:HIRA-interacting protein 5 [Myriangium duriaei CBS 260.36]|uniref:HIRA-interacting protein 5 n=1 Tax=Myriangium duriaei CBS 260.36 TaxID=1168546 RepID=A0A9P4J6Z5_9PEZI|nr:HIRA-interacting protein 5 [Myriangium duriaei CBS 260.36]
MAAQPSRLLARSLRQCRTNPTRLCSVESPAPSRARQLHSAARSSALTSTSSSHRPRLPLYTRPSIPGPGKRTIFIQTEDTPNVDALKFKPNHRVLPESFPNTFLEFLSPRSTLAPPHPSPLAAQLMNVEGVTSIFYGADYITVTKESGQNWAHIKPEVFSLITEAVTSGQPIVTSSGDRADGSQAPIEEDSLAYDENDSEVVSMIKELLETRIRPAIQEDGGDIDFRGFEDGQVKLKLRGACRTCDSSTVTLRNGIESMLMHYIEEVKGVQQVMDEEEEVALREFAKFEEKLKAQKGEQAVASTGGKGTLDAAE